MAFTRRMYVNNSTFLLLYSKLHPLNNNIVFISLIDRIYSCLNLSFHGY